MFFLYRYNSCSTCPLKILFRSGYCEPFAHSFEVERYSYNPPDVVCVPWKVYVCVMSYKLAWSFGTALFRGFSISMIK